MRLFDFSHDAMIGAAQGRLDSLRWRVLMNTFYAIGASFVMESLIWPALWVALLTLSMFVDARFAQNYLTAEEGASRDRRRAVFVSTAIFTLIIFVVMPMMLALTAHGPGRSLAILMCTSSLVALMAYLYTAPGFLLISMAPTTLCILAIPLLPQPTGTVPWINGAIGMMFGVVGFLIYLTRSALRTERMLDQVNAATRAAEARRAEAEAGSRAKTEFLAQMTHELRTPLNAVIGYAEILHEDLEAGLGAQPADAARIHEAARRLIGIVDVAVDASKMETGNIKFDAGVVDSVMAEEWREPAKV